MNRSLAVLAPVAALLSRAASAADRLAPFLSKGSDALPVWRRRA